VINIWVEVIPYETVSHIAVDCVVASHVALVTEFGAFWTSSFKVVSVVAEEALGLGAK
jgi:hypothetical protein